MTRTNSMIAAVAAGLLLMGGAAVLTGADQDRDRQRDRDQIGERKTLEGTVVDMYHFLAHGESESPEYMDPQRMRNVGGPVGILVEEDRLIGTSKEVYLVVFAPTADPATPPRRDTTPPRRPGGPQDRDQDRDQDRQWDRDRDRTPQQGKALYEQVQRMAGQRVRIVGNELEREGVKAIAITQVQPHTQPGERPGQPDRR